MIEAKNVSKHFGALQVLKSMSFSVERGEVVCLIGPSGSGKSTMLRCINGLENYDGGTITVDGTLVDANAKSIHAIRTQVGMVFQRFNLFPHMTATENIIEGPTRVKRVPKLDAIEDAHRLLKKVGLSDKASSYPSQLSGGQQQRVAIARALAMKPKAILFDEPTSALDPETVGEVLGVMQDLAIEGMTMLIVTHEMGFAAEVASRVLFLDRGEILEQGPAKEVLRRPENPRTQDFLRRVLHPVEGLSPSAFQ
jgi:polar amino acid transport system ATP-binding protein